MTKVQNGITLQNSWRELVNFVGAWGGNPGDLMTLLREAKDHIHFLHEKEVLGIKEVIMPPEAKQKMVDSFEDQRKRLSSYGIEFPTDNFHSLL